MKGTESYACWEIVRNYFGDSNKAYAWFQQPNAVLAGVSPLALLRQGKGKQLLAKIKKYGMRNLV